MKGDVIPDKDHVVRYCIPRTVNRRTGFPDSEAFTLKREIGEDSLSVNWIEYFGRNVKLNTRDEREDLVAQVRRVIQYDLDRRGAFAFFGVEEMKWAVERGAGLNPFVEQDPKGPQPATGRRAARGPDPSHALVYGFPEDDHGVGVELRALVIANTNLKLFSGVTKPVV